MLRCCPRAFCLIFVGLVLLPLVGTRLPAQEKPADWLQFRGLGVSSEKGLPIIWSHKDNLAWKADLPGPGASSPIVVGQRVFLTSYTGYGVPGQPKGDLAQLKRHVLCLNRSDGKILWTKPIDPKQPESNTVREHGYAASTPAADAERLYVFFGKSGVFAFDHAGKQLWHADVGAQVHGWGSAASPVLYEDLVIINACVESESLFALDKKTGKEVWRAKGIQQSWSTPLLVTVQGGKTELVVPMQGKILGFDPHPGKGLWTCDTDIAWYMVPGLVAHDGVVYSIGGVRWGFGAKRVLAVCSNSQNLAHARQAGMGPNRPTFFRAILIVSNRLIRKIHMHQQSHRCPGSITPSATRRGFLQNASAGFGWLALQGLFSGQAVAAPLLRPKAKNVIFCFMDCGPSHVDTFDYKPMLKKNQSQPIGPQWISKRSDNGAGRVWLGSPWEFKQRGDSGLWVSDLFPQLAQVADHLCVVRSMVGELPLHGQSNLLLHTGRVGGQAPSLGAWISYGLGTENANLPAYVLLSNDWVPNGGLENFGSSFLPASHQATVMRSKGIAVDNITPRDTASLQQQKLALLAEGNAAFGAQTSDPQAIEAAIENYETAFRMQSSVPELADISREPEHIQKMYGVDSADEHQRFYATQALRARRLVEASVRFVEITCPSFDGNNSPWDQHTHLKLNHEKNARVTEQSVAALITDLHQRGLLDETIVLWAGEMGRTPAVGAINDVTGRDHHVSGYTIFMAGGGFKGGITYGETDEFGTNAIVDPITVHEIHATILHKLGLDHERLTFRYGGRDIRLTDVHGRVVKEILHDDNQRSVWDGDTSFHPHLMGTAFY